MFFNYSPSKLKTFEIIRHTNQLEMTVLIYLIENTKKSKFTQILLPKKCKAQFETDIEFCLKSIRTHIYEYSITPTLGLDRCEVIYNVLFENEIKPYYTTDVNMKFGRLNIINFIKLLQNFRTKSQITNDEYFQCLMHNLNSYDYSDFVKNIKNYLLPTYTQIDRNEHKLYTRNDTTRYFSNFYKKLQNESIEIHNINPKTFDTLWLPRPKRIYQEIHTNSNYIRQPLYHGWHTIINFTGKTTRCYNRYGEILQTFLYGIKFNKPATFEAIILPITKNKEIKSWRSLEHHDFVIIIVDIFRIEQTMFTNLPFIDRHSQIHQITNSKIRYENEIFEQYATNNIANCFDPYITGFIYRKKSDLYFHRPIEYRFSLNRYYIYLKNLLYEYHGSISLKKNQMHLNVYPNFEMAKYRTVCIAYADDTDFFYICKYRPELFQYVYVGKIRKLPSEKENLSQTEYKQQYIFVINAQIEIKGVLLLRIYYNDTNDYNSLMGYEKKITTSIYDIPAYNTRNDLFL